MKIIRYQDSQGKIAYAQQTAQGTFDLEGDPYASVKATQKKSEVLKILAPIVPTQILCIGLNYRKHAEECGAPIPERPVLFVKGVNALQNPGDPIVLPRHARSDEVDYECELGVVIGKPCKNVTREKALDYVLGYTCVNDVSARDWQLKWGGGQWCKGKFFDTFAPIGPCLVTPDEIPNPNALKIKTVLNGETVQDWTTSDMIFDVRAIIEFLSASTTLIPGTLILTGTPQGVGMASKPPKYLKAGDSVTIEIEKIGSITNPVIEESQGIVQFHGYTKNRGGQLEKFAWVNEGFIGASIACAALEPRIKAEVLMSVGLMDTVCPPSTQFAMYNKITSAKSLRIYPDFAHEGLPKDNDAVFSIFSLFIKPVICSKNMRLCIDGKEAVGTFT